MDRAESSSMAAPDVDVIIVSHNGQDHLERAIASLTASRGVRVNVVVVDNASVDGTVNEARRLGARIIELEDNRGYGSAANVGLANAGATWSVVCNQDIVVDPDVLRLLVEAAVNEEQSCRQPAIVSPGLVGMNGGLVETAHRLPTLSTEVVGLLMGEERFGGRSVLTATSSAQHCEWVSGAFLLARHDLWQELGGFDQAFFMYMEDVDLFDRLRVAGRHCIWVPEARVVHLGGRRPLDASLFALGLRSRQHYWSTRRGRVAGQVVLTAAIVGASARSIKWTLLSCRVSGRGDVEARAYAKMFRRAAWICARRSRPRADARTPKAGP
jgi:N-acetylglucosaminyl-diphospho-decaprenol L-rhamnosyltransferase